MLPLLRLPAGDAVHRRPAACGVARAADDLRLVLLVACHDGLEAGVRPGDVCVDSSDAQGAEPLHVECELDYTEGRQRSGERLGGFYQGDGRRIPAAARV